MKYIRYSRYTGETADDIDLQELLKRLGDFFLQSGFESQYYGVSEFSPEQTMEQLREAILRALSEGDPAQHAAHRHRGAERLFAVVTVFMRISHDDLGDS